MFQHLVAMIVMNKMFYHDKSGELLKTQNHSSVVTSRHKEHGDAHFTALLAICGLINPSTASAAPFKIARKSPVDVQTPPMARCFRVTT